MTSQLTYLATILVFAGSAIVLEWYFGYRQLERYIKVIGAVLLISLLATAVGDNVAIRWKTWVYHPEGFSAIYILGVPLETYLFALFCSVAVSSAALGWSEFEEQGESLIKRTFNLVVRKLKAGFRRLPL